MPHSGPNRAPPARPKIAPGTKNTVADGKERDVDERRPWTKIADRPFEQRGIEPIPMKREPELPPQR